MNTKLSSLFTWVVSLAIIGGLAWYFLRQHKTQVNENDNALNQELMTDAKTAALALKYHAVTNWEASLPDRGVATQPFSIDISRALILSNGQPVLIKMNLKDIAENNGSYTASFGKDFITPGMFQLSVDLKCTQEQASQFVKDTNSYFFRTYAVIARIDKIDHPKFKVGSIGNGEDASIELDDSSDVFLANGELLEATPLP